MGKLYCLPLWCIYLLYKLWVLYNWSQKFIYIYKTSINFIFFWKCFWIHFKEGDRVYLSETGTGMYAQFTVCNQENVYRLHPSLTFNQGAALGVPYLTAYRALFQK